jgi:hypothetical protein
MPTQQSYTFASHTSQPTSQSLQKSLPAPRQDKFNFFLPSLRCFNFFATHSRHISGWTETAKTHTGKGLTMTVDKRPACNSGFAKMRVQWLIEHSMEKTLKLPLVYRSKLTPPVATYRNPKNPIRFSHN